MFGPADRHWGLPWVVRGLRYSGGSLVVGGEGLVDCGKY